MGSGIDTYEAEIAADSIIWELCARKSAECLNLRNSFITISTWGQTHIAGRPTQPSQIKKTTSEWTFFLKFTI